MDHFGIGAAIKGVVQIYLRSARGTGRSVSLLDSLSDNDRVVFASSKEAERMRGLFKEDGKDVECIVVDPREPNRLFERGTSIKRTIFDHTWIEEFYMNAIEKCEKEIDFFQRELSGYGEPHRETRRKAQEISRWAF